MVEKEYQRGVAEALADVASSRYRLYFQVRGKWGELFKDLMQERFSVQVVHISCLTDDGKLSYENGYNNTIREFLDDKFGVGEYERTWDEVQAYREDQYRQQFRTQSDDA